MGPFSRAILIGCLDALRWLFWLGAGLLVLLVVVQAFRGDADALPKSNLAGAAALAALGWLCGFAARKLTLPR